MARLHEFVRGPMLVSVSRNPSCHPFRTRKNDLHRVETGQYFVGQVWDKSDNGEIYRWSVAYNICRRGVHSVCLAFERWNK